MYSIWLQENKTKIEEEGHKFVEAKWWFISRYECTLIKRDKKWWINNIEHVLSFYNDLMLYKNSPEKLNILKQRIIEKKKNKKNIQTLNNFVLISEDEDN